MVVNPPSKRLVGLLTLLIAGALGVSVYLLVGALSGTQGVSGVPGCGAGSGCGAVLSSRWATWFGLPVSLPAVVLDAALLAGCLVLLVKPRAWRPWMAAAMSVGAGALLGAGAWFLYLQAVELGAFCKFCLAAHACGIMFAVLALAFLPRPPMGRRVGLAALGLVLAMALPAGQLLLPGRTSRVERVAVLGGQIELDPTKLPILGEPDAEIVAVYLFDYTCPHCRKMHEYLGVARSHFGDRLAILTLPAPLDAACNDEYLATPPQHENACGLAELALASWRADPAAFEAVHDALLHVPTPVTDLAAARDAIDGLVDLEAVEAERATGWPSRQVAADLAVYHATDGVLPQLLVGEHRIVGQPASADELIATLTDIATTDRR